MMLLKTKDKIIASHTIMINDQRKKIGSYEEKLIALGELSSKPSKEVVEAVVRSHEEYRDEKPSK